MYVNEILEKIPGINRSQLAWWEKVGYLKPAKVKRGKHLRRIYTEDDVVIIETALPYYRKGVKTRRAFELALQDLRLRRKAAAPPSSVGQKPLYDIIEKGMDTFIDKIFAGKELSLEEICLRTLSVLNSPKYREQLTGLLCLLPIEQTPSGKYRYRRKDRC